MPNTLSQEVEFFSEIYICILYRQSTIAEPVDFEFQLKSFLFHLNERFNIFHKNIKFVHLWKTE